MGLFSETFATESTMVYSEINVVYIVFFLATIV